LALFNTLFLILLWVICSCLSKIATSCLSPNFSTHDAAGYEQWRRQHFIPARPMQWSAENLLWGRVGL